MSKIIQAIRGMNDHLPDQLVVRQMVEKTLRDCVTSYGYQEIRFPIVESTQLFKRSIGEVTDIVEKEMYTFLDKNGDSLSLRPEGTASCVRAGIQHGLFYNQTQRLWYMGPMFRHERPQKGRYRQFDHFGVEAFGFKGPDVDIELILLTARIWKLLNVTPHVTLQINSLGSAESRAQYREHLIEYFTAHKNLLDEDSQRRLVTNPLRILDSKNSEMQSVIEKAPSLLDFLDSESIEHFDRIKESLKMSHVDYQINPRLVRGLDYYNRTVFEWVSNLLGAQSTVCAGGRYDGLVEQLGGHATPAVGFAIGIDRLVEIVNQTPEVESAIFPVDIYVIHQGENARIQSQLIVEQLHEEFPTLTVINHCGESSMKRQFKDADKSLAKIALIIGEDEAANHEVSIKYLRQTQDQFQISQNALAEFINNYFN